jgi:hypothetical protein
MATVTFSPIAVLVSIGLVIGFIAMVRENPRSRGLWVGAGVVLLFLTFGPIMHRLSPSWHRSAVAQCIADDMDDRDMAFEEARRLCDHYPLVLGFTLGYGY